MLNFKVLLITFLSATALLAGTIESHAQTGIKGGVNFSIIGGDIPDDLNAESKTGVTFGISHQFDVNDNVAFRPEVIFLQKGYVSNIVFDIPVEIEQTFILDYVDVFLPAVITAQTQHNFSPQFFAGPFLGYNINAEVESRETRFGGDAVTASMDISDDINSLDYGVAFGLGGLLNLQRGAILIDVRFNLGLAEIFDADPVMIDQEDFDGEPEIPEGDTFNRGLMLTVGYQF